MSQEENSDISSTVRHSLETFAKILNERPRTTNLVFENLQATYECWKPEGRQSAAPPESYPTSLCLPMDGVNTGTSPYRLGLRKQSASRRWPEEGRSDGG